MAVKKKAVKKPVKHTGRRKVSAQRKPNLRKSLVVTPEIVEEGEGPPPSFKNASEQEQKFVLYLFIHGSALKAAVMAGYSQNTSRSVAASWIGASRDTSLKPHLFDLYNDLKQEQIEQYKVKAGLLIKEYCRIGFADLGKFLKYDEVQKVMVIDMEAIRDGDTACISEITQDTMESQSNGSIRVIRTKLKMHNKIGALDGLCKMLGLQLLKMDLNDPRSVPIGGTPYTGMAKGMDDAEATQLYLNVLNQKSAEDKE